VSLLRTELESSQTQAQSGITLSKQYFLTEWKQAAEKIADPLFLPMIFLNYLTFLFRIV
jgi:hypothetical protein